MKIISFYNINEFVICCGYKGYVIKEYFRNLTYHSSNFTINFSDNRIDFHNKIDEPWKVHLIDTGENTMTGGRLKRVKEFIGDDSFLFTYGDGLSNINIDKLIQSHKKSGLEATITAVRPPSRFGVLDLDGHLVKSFKEKPQSREALINGGFFILNPTVIDLIDGDNCIWEHEPLEKLCLNKNLNSYYHEDFWYPMDTLRDKNKLENLWNKNEAPWKIWK